MSKLRIGDLQKKVTLESVCKAIEKFINDEFEGEHTVDLGDAGDHTIYCTNEMLSSYDVDTIIETLSREATE